jgi:hypothetical protein
LSGAEIVALYVFLRGRQADLDERLAGVYDRLERYLYDRLSIEEIEQIDRIYKNNIEVLLRNIYP